MPVSTFEVLAEPARRALLDLLVDGDRAVGELVEATGLSQPNTSRHLRILREAGLVEALPAGQRRLYRLRPAALAEVDRWLAPYRRRWTASLDALEHHLDEHQLDDTQLDDTQLDDTQQEEDDDAPRP